MKVICIANQKGGIAKTTTATTLASILMSQGKKVLLVDADPQGNSTDTYRAVSKDTATLYDVILDIEDPLPIAEAIQRTEIGDIVASDPELKTADQRFPSDGNEYFRLKDALSELTGYDYVIIDTAPADNKLLKNCLIASDKVIIPVTADRYAIQGLSELNRTIRGVEKRNNPNLEVAGLLLVKYKSRQLLAQEVKASLEEIAKQLNTKVFCTTIRESIAVQKAQATRTTLMNFEPKCNAAIDYVQFAEELIKE
jgi:chromosome partitioning protein